ncbi:MAG: hypothetical protein ACE5HS_02715 [bacterium]
MSKNSQMMVAAFVFTLGLVISGFVGLLAQASYHRNAGSNPNYQQGDWISYSVARYITSIAEGDEHIFFGTRHAGITRYNKFQNRWDYPYTTSNGLADNEITAVAFDFSTGFLWCASRTAISYYHPTAERWSNFFKDEFGLPVFDDIELIKITKNAVYFKSVNGRVFETNIYGGVILNARNGISFARSKNDNFQHFFMSNGYLFDPSGFVEDFHFRSAEIQVSFKDDWGNLWIGTNGLGAGRGDVHSLRLEMLNFGLLNASVNAMTFHEGVLWLGGNENFGSVTGITAWDMNRSTWDYYEQRDVSALLSDKIYSITSDGKFLWFATGYGLSYYSPRERSWKTLNNFDGLSDNLVFDIEVDDSTIWVATANGIDRILKRNLTRKDSLNVEKINPGNLTIVEVYELERIANLLWAATSQGIYVYDTKKKEGGFNAEVGGPVNRRVTTLSRYENEIWFGSDQGIDVYDLANKTWRGVPEGRFFPNKVINKILATKEAVWAATNQGILKYERRSKAWRTFDTEDGLLDNRVNAILLDGDYIWFGTDSGLTQFFWNDPNRVD